MYFNFSIASTSNQIKNIERDWGLLAERVHALFYQESNWYIPLKASLIKEIKFIVGKKEKDLVLILPVVYNEQTQVLSLPVCYQTDIVDCLLDKRVTTTYFFRELSDFLDQTFPKWKKFENPRLIEDSHCWYLFNHLDLKTHFDAFEKNSFFPTLIHNAQESLAPSQFKHARKHERKLLKHTKISKIGYLKTNLQSVERFFTLEDASWKGASGKNTSILSDSNTLQFYEAISENFARGNKLRIFGCESDDVLIAGKLGIMSRNRLYLLKTAYLPDFSKFSVGNILIANLINQAENDPEINEINLVTGPTWADRWMPAQHDLYWGTVYRASYNGNLSFAKQVLKDRLRPMKHIFKRVCSKLRAFLHTKKIIN